MMFTAVVSGDIGMNETLERDEVGNFLSKNMVLVLFFKVK